MNITLFIYLEATAHDDIVNFVTFEEALYFKFD